MLENVNIYSSVAVYAQIENEVQFGIASGQLKGDDQLPSVLGLSEKLGVNPNTVAKAYRDLEVMGYLYTRRGMGVYINKGVEAKCREQCRKRTIGRVHEVVAEAKAAGMTVKEIRDVVSACQASDAGPYSPVPDSLLALAKAKKGAK